MLVQFSCHHLLICTNLLSQFLSHCFRLESNNNFPSQNIGALSAGAKNPVPQPSVSRDLKPGRKIPGSVTMAASSHHSVRIENKIMLHTVRVWNPNQHGFQILTNFLVFKQFNFPTHVCQKSWHFSWDFRQLVCLKTEDTKVGNSEKFRFQTFTVHVQDWTSKNPDSFETRTF